uniref:Uncharacterized protein n=1 Tax=Opuntia streptacantha TaxID=393608 RepID=A0A7C9ADJ5_OPUST
MHLCLLLSRTTHLSIFGLLSFGFVIIKTSHCMSSTPGLLLCCYVSLYCSVILISRLHLPKSNRPYPGPIRVYPVRTEAGPIRSTVRSWTDEQPYFLMYTQYWNNVFMYTRVRSHTHTQYLYMNVNF